MSKCKGWLSSICRKRNLQTDRSMQTPLNRCLSTTNLIFYAIAQMAGAGVYVLTGTLIRDHAGPGAFLSYIGGAVSAIFTALCFAEFATLIPRAGSCYSYTYIFIGEFPAFIIGWTMLSDYIVGMASIAKAFSGTINLLSGNAISNWTEKYVGVMAENSSFLGRYLDFIAFGFLILLVLLVMLGAKSSLTVNSTFTVIQVVCLFIISIACFIFGDIDNWTEKGGMFPNGFSGVLSGASIAIFAFSGFDALANAVEETINPRKSLPIALFTSLSIITVLYCFASLGLSYLVPRDDIDYASPFVSGFFEVHQPVFKWIAAVGTLLATGATKIASMYAVPRMVYTMASDGLLFSPLAYVTKSTQVPIVSLVTCGLLSAVLALLINIESLAEFVSLGILISYFMIGVNLIVMRYLFNASEAPEITRASSESTLSTDDRNPLVTNSGILPLRWNLSWNKLATRNAFKLIFGIHVIGDLLLASSYALYNLVPHNHILIFIVVGLGGFLVLVTFGLLCCFKPIESSDSFSAPFMPLTPLMTILVNMVLLIGMNWLTWIRCIIWLGIGIPIYLFYGIGHSKVDHVLTENNTYQPVKPNLEIELKMTEDLDVQETK